MAVRKVKLSAGWGQALAERIFPATSLPRPPDLFFLDELWTRRRRAGGMFRVAVVSYSELIGMYQGRTIVFIKYGGLLCLSRVLLMILLVTTPGTL